LVRHACFERTTHAIDASASTGMIAVPTVTQAQTHAGIFRSASNDSALGERHASHSPPRFAHPGDGGALARSHREESTMPVVHFLRSNAGRLLKVAAGVWLLAAGMTVATFGGLVMTMAGVFLAVTGLAAICFTDGVSTWTTSQTPSHAHRDHT
jgi:hypothetical protein